MRDRCSLLLNSIPKQRDFGYQVSDESCCGVSMVIQHPQGLCRPNSIPVKVREHLLAALKARIDKEHNGNRLMSKIRVRLHSLFQRGPTMLSVIDYQS